MYPSSRLHNQEGFTIIEMMIAVGVMIIVTGGVFTLMKGSMTIATANYELTDAQESLRTAQEYINRDLMNAGDGLKSMSTIRVPSGFVTSYVTLNPIVDPLDNMPAGVINLGILTTDNNVPAGTAVTGANPAATVRTNTDRQTILEIDPDPTFPGIALPTSPVSIDATGSIITCPAGTDMTQFNVGEIYFFISSRGGTFGTITNKNAGTRTLTFANGDTYGLNLSGAGGHILTICSDPNTGARLPASLQRMRIIQYYVNSTGFLMRRVFGVKGAGFRESIIAEHVLNVQFNYALDMTDAAGNVVQPTAALTTRAQRLNVRQVEVTVTVETPHNLQNGARSILSQTTSTSVRNMQFRQAQQPGS